MSERTTRLEMHVDAPRARVFRAFVDPRDVEHWMVPTGMTSRVHLFEAREGGAFRVSLTYDEPTGAGKTSARTDTYHGRFVTLVPGEKIVEVMEFETADPSMQGEMTMTVTLSDAPGGGTRLVASHERIPPGISLEDNETGWRISLGKLAQMLAGS